MCEPENVSLLLIKNNYKGYAKIVIKKMWYSVRPTPRFNSTE